MKTAPGSGRRPHMEEPPVAASWLLSRLLPGEDAEFVLGDLAESYNARVRRGGRFRAWAWYWWEAVRSVAPALRLRATRRAVRRRPGSSGRSSSEDSAGRTLNATVREARSFVDALGFRLAVRRLAAAPAFAIGAVVVLASGIGATTALMALVHGVLLRPLPYSEPQRLVWIGHAAPGLGVPEAGMSSGLFLRYQEQARSLERIGLYNEAVVNLGGGEGDAESVSLTMATPSLLELLGVRPSLGRIYTAADDRERPGGDNVLISHDLWMRRFGGSVNVLDQHVTVNLRPRRILGVMPPDFRFPRPETDVWMINLPSPEEARIGDLYYTAIGRLRRGSRAADATRELQALIATAAGSYPDATAERLAQMRLAPIIIPLHERVVGGVARSLWVVLAGVALVLIVACANTATLCLVRSEQRRRELAVRAALGASRSQLIGLFLTEALVLGAVAGALGGWLAAAAVRAAVAARPFDIPRIEEVGVDGTLIVFAAAIAILAALFFGSIPALRATAGHVSAGVGAASRGGTPGPERQRVRAGLIAAQVALALVLLSAGGLLLRSYWNLVNVERGFDQRNVLVLELRLPHRKAPNHEAAVRFWNGLLDRARALPGVLSAGAATSLPLVADAPSFRFAVIDADGQDPAGAPATVFPKLATPGYLETLRTRVIEGAAIDAGLASTADNPVLISESLARRLFPGRSAIGERVRRLGETGAVHADRAPFTVAGVVEDVREFDLAASPPEILYIPVLESQIDEFVPDLMAVVLRTSGPALALAPALRRIVREMDPDLGVISIRPMDRIFADATARTSFTTLLVLMAAVTALLLGAVGTYAVIAYGVTLRKREIGIRIALGARSRDVQRTVLRTGLGPVLVGLTMGAALALAATRVLRSLLYGVSPLDQLTLGAALLCVAAAAFLAAWIPARRAARVDPRHCMNAE